MGRKKKTKEHKKVKTWEESYADMIKFKREHGNLLVPKAEEELFNWAKAQRVLFRAGKLPEEKKAKLDEIGFVWNMIVGRMMPELNQPLVANLSRSESRSVVWGKHYTEMKEYMEKKGNLPGTGSRLHAWLIRQRQKDAQGKLKPDYIKLLDQLPIPWRPDRRRRRRKSVGSDEEENEAKANEGNEHPQKRKSSPSDDTTPSKNNKKQKTTNSTWQQEKTFTLSEKKRLKQKFKEKLKEQSRLRQVAAEEAASQSQPLPSDFLPLLQLINEQREANSQRIQGLEAMFVDIANKFNALQKVYEESLQQEDLSESSEEEEEEKEMEKEKETEKKGKEKEGPAHVPPHSSSSIWDDEDLDDEELERLRLIQEEEERLHAAIESDSDEDDNSYEEDNRAKTPTKPERPNMKSTEDSDEEESESEEEEEEAGMIDFFS